MTASPPSPEPAHAGAQSIELLSGGEALFPRMLEAIDAARSSVHLEIYTLRLDSVGRRFVSALSQAARRDVRVRVILDGWGSVEDGAEVFSLLREAGCAVKIYNPLSAWVRGKLLRNHRKILVVDEQVAYVGGINIAEPYASSPARPGWADLAVEVRGPACRWLAERLRGIRHPAPIPGDHVRIHLSGIGGGRRLRRRYLQALKHARASAYLAHAYFLPDARFIRALTGAARRGVDVMLLLAGRSDVPFARAATMRLYRQLLLGGVKIYEWDQSVLHAKAAVVDGERLLVGSFNLDPLSLVNLEALVEVRRHPAVVVGERWIQSRAAFSREVTLESCSRSPVQRWLTDVLGLWAARLTQWWAQLGLPRRVRPLRPGSGTR
jgi:cardiolipin synthase